MQGGINQALRMVFSNGHRMSRALRSQEENVRFIGDLSAIGGQRWIRDWPIPDSYRQDNKHGQLPRNAPMFHSCILNRPRGRAPSFISVSKTS